VPGAGAADSSATNQGFYTLVRTQLADLRRGGGDGATAARTAASLHVASSPVSASGNSAAHNSSSGAASHTPKHLQLPQTPTSSTRAAAGANSRATVTPKGHLEAQVPYSCSAVATVDVYPGLRVLVGVARRVLRRCVWGCGAALPHRSPTWRTAPAIWRTDTLARRSKQNVKTLMHACSRMHARTRTHADGNGRGALPTGRPCSRRWGHVLHPGSSLGRKHRHKRHGADKNNPCRASTAC